MLLNIKGKTYIVTKRRIFIDSSKITYYTNNVKGFRRVIFLFPPGVSDGSFYVSLFKNFKKTDLLISLDYPGRGGSYPVSDNSIENISFLMSKVILKICKRRRIKNYYLFGISYGGSIALETIKYTKKEKISKIILISSGEYISSRSRLFLKVLLIFCIHFSFTRTILFELNKYIHIFEDFPKDNLGILFSQLDGVIKYKISYTILINIPATIIWFSRDNIIRKSSKIKIEKLFKNKNILYMHKNEHKIRHREVTKEFINSVLK